MGSGRKRPNFGGAGTPQRGTGLSQMVTRQLATAVTVALVAAGVLSAVYALGQYALGHMMADEAIARAELWSRTLGNGASIETALAGSTPEALAGTLRLANIDRVLLISKKGDPLPVYGPDDSAQLGNVVAARAGTRLPLQQAASGAYTLDRVSWIQRAPYHSWVILPASDPRDPRLALRVDQTATAADLIYSFSSEGLFSGGVAAVTFISFMAGFHYRQRQLSTENAAIRFLALHDELTGLANRKQFESSWRVRLPISRQAATRRRFSFSTSMGSSRSMIRSGIPSATAC